MIALVRVFEFVLVPLCLVALAYEPNYAHGFINYNESGQHLAAIRELARGSLLFRDLFVQYGPLHYFVPYWTTGIFGESIPTLRGYFLAGEIAGFLAMLGLCRALIPSRVFATAAAFVIVMEAHHPFWSTRWGGFRFAFVYLSLWCLVIALQQRRPRLLFLAGLSGALALLHTYDAGAAACLAGGVYFVCRLSSEELRSNITQDLAYYVSGFAAALLPFFIYLVATGTLGDYIVQLPLLNPGRAWVQPLPPGVITPTVLAPGVIYLLGLGFVVRRFPHERREEVVAGVAPMIVVMSSGLLLYAVSFRAIRGPQFETSLPLALLVLFFLMAHGFAHFERSLESSDKQARGWLGFGFVVISMLAIAGLEIRTYGGGPVRWASYQFSKADLVSRHAGAKPLDANYRSIEVRGAGSARVPLTQAREIEEIVAYLGEITTDDDAVLGYPDLGIFNYFADRPHATRFTIAILAAADPAWSEEVLRVVREQRPAAILIGNQASTLARATRHSGEYLPELPDLVQRFYHLDRHFERLDVYRPNESVSFPGEQP
jgi:hypothetical protein